MLGWRVVLALLALAALMLPVAGNPAELLTVAAAGALAAVALLLVWTAPDSAARPILVRGQVLRERAEASAFLRTRDPDAAGRVRPRAPGQFPAAQ
jgi:Family of unknown function (DUF6412)